MWCHVVWEKCHDLRSTTVWQSPNFHATVISLLPGCQNQCERCYEVVNMVAKLENCTKEEQRSMIRFLWAESASGRQIHQCMCAQYGDNALSCRLVYKWIGMFKNGRTSATDSECSGHPTTAITAQTEERARELILQNRRVMVNEISKQQYQRWVCLFCGAW
jgi:hypothetical protein